MKIKADKIAAELKAVEAKKKAKEEDKDDGEVKVYIFDKPKCSIKLAVGVRCVAYSFLDARTIVTKMTVLCVNDR